MARKFIQAIDPNSIVVEGGTNKVIINPDSIRVICDHVPSKGEFYVIFIDGSTRVLEIELKVLAELLTES